MAYSLDNIFIESNFEVEDIYDVYELGTVVNNKDSSFLIYEKEAKTFGSAIKFYYKVCREGSIKTKKLYNDEIQGLVVSGEVTDVCDEDVFVKFSFDSGLKKSRHRFEWLPITGNVLYCMPEVGSKVKVYFGDSDEGENTFAIECENMSAFSNEIKGIVTKNGKTMHIKDNGVELKADNKVSISGKNMAFSSSDSLIMSARK